MSRYRSSYATPEQVLAEALYLELVAPGEAERRGAALIVAELSAGLDEATIELARAAARERFELDSER